MQPGNNADLRRERVHSGCLLCGAGNPWSFRLTFAPDADGVKSKFQTHPNLQGYDGILHGGVTSALLDAAMTHCLFHHGVRAVTADLHVRFLHPIPCPECLALRSWMAASKPPLYKVKSELWVEDRLMARAEASFIRFM
ncbi:MAG TPA: PaaI family thioesterase [bacterium]|nr:PaaI family thioesterase [bacterium]